MTHTSRAARLRPHPGGFTLIEIAVVIVVLSLLLAMIAGLGTAMLGQQRREATRQRLAGVETAIALFVSQNQRLPCPANGALPSTDAAAGLEKRSGGTCENSQQYGVVPWRTLGLGEPDATDGWGNRLTYRVAQDFVADESMNFTDCDPGPTFSGGTATACAAGCSTLTFPGGCTNPAEVTKGKGLRVCNLQGAVVMNPSPGTAFSAGNCAYTVPVPTPDPEPASTGAAYVVISHGENAWGSYNNQGVQQVATGTDSGTEETRNAANLAIATYYVDDFPSYSAGTGHFDDFVLRPSILSVATKAQLGPRAH